MMVKFCGMTNIEDVMCAVDLGVDYVGFIFYRGSERYVAPETVKDIVERVYGLVKTVGVFVEEDENQIKEIMHFCSLDYAQVYRDMCGLRDIRVYRIRDELPSVRDEGLLLFDSFTPSIGGSGVSFNVELVKDVDYKDRLFVAGGVDCSSVGYLMELGVYGVDLVSSIEAYKGKKDHMKMERFVKIVREL